jgi:hypothetical protein
MESMIAPSKPRRNKQTSEDIANAPDALDQEQPLRFALFSLNVWARSEAVADFESTLTRRLRTAATIGISGAGNGLRHVAIAGPVQA